jgi:O-antigen/teichoic acid export membrane protein
MAAEKNKTVPANAPSQHASFFRQSGWLMIAAMSSGVLMYGVHLLSKKIPASEYGTLITLFSVVGLIPTIPFQMVFTHQTAAGLAKNRDRQLTSMIRAAGLGIFLFWAAAMFIVFVFRNQVAANWHLVNPLALWMTMVVILFSLLMPLFQGVMQGQQNFLWLGWSNIFNGISRLAAAVFIVLVLGGQATGIMTGVFIGLAAATAVGSWQTRALWLGSSEPFNRREFLREVVPLLLGFAATQFLFCADTPFVDSYFGAEKTAPYGAAGTMSRALLWLVLPLAAVMFPKIVHSTAKSEKSNLLGLVLLGTAVLVGLGVLSLWILGPWVVRLVYPPEYVSQTLAILPWYAGAMVPLALANVLVNDLLGRGKFQIVPFLVLLAMLYGLALTQHHGSFIAVLKMLGMFNLVLFAICAWFTWGRKSPAWMDKN